MVVFRNLKVKECPICQCSVIVSESVETTPYKGGRAIREHTNGQWWERREFLCGYIVRWVPNFRSAETVELCRHSQDYKEFKVVEDHLRKKVQLAEEKLREHMTTKPKDHRE